ADARVDEDEQAEGDRDDAADREAAGNRHGDLVDLRADRLHVLPPNLCHQGRRRVGATQATVGPDASPDPPDVLEISWDCATAGSSCAALRRTARALPMPRSGRLWAPR